MDLARQGSRSRSRRRLAGPRETRGSEPRRLSLFRQQGNRREKRCRLERQDPKFQAIDRASTNRSTKTVCPFRILRRASAMRERKLSEIQRHVLRVSCRRCERTVEIQTVDAVRLYGGKAVWKDVAQRPANA